MSRILLDTCAAIWFSDGEKLAPDASKCFEAAAAGLADIYLSPISAWEIGLLVSRKRYITRIDPTQWFDLLVRRGQFAVAEMTPRLLAASSFLPGSIQGDPADRIIVATARENGYRIMTRDRKILDYADQGHVDAIAC